MNLEVECEAIRSIIATASDADTWSEDDTRTKCLDVILRKVLRWQDPSIRRNVPMDSDGKTIFADYVLSKGSQDRLVIEAKRWSEKFGIPDASAPIRYRMSGAPRTWACWSAIKQAREYCDNLGIRFALITNGHEFVAFQAVSEVGRWTDLWCVVFRSLDDVVGRIQQFFECFSSDSIERTELAYLCRDKPAVPNRKSPRDVLGVATSGHRNELYTEMHKMFESVLLDNSEMTVEMLDAIYCTNDDLVKYGRHLDSTIDPSPVFIEPVQEVATGVRRDAFDEAMKLQHSESIQAGSNRAVIVVAGGLGVGKSTFLRWYFGRGHASDGGRDPIVIRIDYLSTTAAGMSLPVTTAQAVIESIETQCEPIVSGFGQQKEIFRDEVRRLTKGTLSAEPDPSERQRKLAEHINEMKKDRSLYLKRIFRYLKEHCGRRVIVVLDNIDQFPELQQREVFQLSMEYARSLGCIVIVAVRESTYARLRATPVVDAFTPIDFHVRGPVVSLVVEKRMNYLKKQVAGKKLELKLSSRGVSATVENLDRFFDLITRSFARESLSQATIDLIELVTNGSTREQLRLLYRFLTSGQTKIGDYFWDYAASKTRSIPFHEFLHSAMLGDCRVFDETLGKYFINLFEPFPMSASGHFTAFRLLDFLWRRNPSLDGGPEVFVPHASILNAFSGCSGKDREVEWHLDRLVTYKLVRTLSGTDEMGAIEQYSLTAAGRYYVRVLIRDATYVSVCATGTSMSPCSDRSDIEELLRRHMGTPKMSLAVRIDIARRFAAYLEREEAGDDPPAGLQVDGRPPRIAPSIAEQVEILSTIVGIGRGGR